MSGEKGFTAQDFYDTIEGTDEANGMTIPEKEVVTDPPAQDPPALNTETETPATPDAPAAPNSEQPNTPPTAQPINLDEELVKTTGGAIKTAAELAELIERSKVLPELETYKSKYEELRTKADVDPFANDYTKKLNDLYKSGATQTQINAFNRINSVEVDKLEPMDARSLALQIKHGLTEKEAIGYLKSEYGLDPTDPAAELTATDAVRLKIDSATDKDYLRTHQAEVSTPAANQQEQQERLMQQQYTERMQKLEPMAKNVVTDVLSNAFKGISINGKTGEGNITTDMPLSEESKRNLEAQVNQMVHSNWNGITPDEKGQEAIKTFAENLLVLQNWKSWAINIASKRELQVRAEYNNPTSIDRGNAAPTGGKTKQQEHADNVMDALELN